MLEHIITILENIENSRKETDRKCRKIKQNFRKYNVLEKIR